MMSLDLIDVQIIRIIKRITYNLWLFNLLLLFVDEKLLGFQPRQAIQL